MKQTEKLTEEEVHYILGAFDIASGETDGDYSSIKNKLYKMYPAVKAEVDDYEVRAQRACDEQDSRRATSVEYVFDDLDLSRPVLQQLKKWIANDDNWEILRGAYSDEICLAGDLWKYHLDDMVTSGLTEELRNHLDEEASKKGNEWMRNDPKTDDELWHTLIKILEKVRMDIRRSNLK